MTVQRHQAAIQPDLVEYHRSIAEEIRVTRDRIRHLIGPAHWLTDGEHKEAVLRKVLRSHLPETVRAGRGFVVVPGGSSTNQIDVLLTAADHPCLFRDADLYVVTPDAVRGIVEVKTAVNSPVSWQAIATKLADDAQIIRSNGGDCWCGIFVHANWSRSPAVVLTGLQAAANADPLRVINCVAIGAQTFVRYWEAGTNAGGPYSGPCWHAYGFPDRLRGLAPAYFVSNAVAEGGRSLSPRYDPLWFPAIGTKEAHRTHWVTLAEPDIHDF